MADNSIRLGTVESSTAQWALRGVKQASSSDKVLDRLVLARLYVAALWILTGVDAGMHVALACAKMVTLQPVVAKGHAWRAVRSGVAAVGVPAPAFIAPSTALKAYSWLELDEAKVGLWSRAVQQLTTAARSSQRWILDHQRLVAAAGAVVAAAVIVYIVAQRAAALKPTKLVDPAPLPTNSTPAQPADLPAPKVSANPPYVLRENSSSIPAAPFGPWQPCEPEIPGNLTTMASKTAQVTNPLLAIEPDDVAPPESRGKQIATALEWTAGLILGCLAVRALWERCTREAAPRGALFARDKKDPETDKGAPSSSQAVPSASATDIPPGNKKGPSGKVKEQTKALTLQRTRQTPAVAPGRASTLTRDAMAWLRGAKPPSSWTDKRTTGQATVSRSSSSDDLTERFHPSLATIPEFFRSLSRLSVTQTVKLASDLISSQSSPRTRFPLDMTNPLLTQGSTIRVDHSAALERVGSTVPLAQLSDEDRSAMSLGSSSTNSSRRSSVSGERGSVSFESKAWSADSDAKGSFDPDAPLSIQAVEVIKQLRSMPLPGLNQDYPLYPAKKVSTVAPVVPHIAIEDPVEGTVYIAHKDLVSAKTGVRIRSKQIKAALDAGCIRLGTLPDPVQSVDGSKEWQNVPVALSPPTSLLANLVGEALAFYHQPLGDENEGEAMCLHELFDFYAYRSPSNVLYFLRAGERLGEGSESGVYRGIRSTDGRAIALGISQISAEQHEESEPSATNWRQVFGDKPGLVRQFEAFNLRIDEQGRLPATVRQTIKEPKKRGKSFGDGFKLRTVFVMQHYTFSLKDYIGENYEAYKNGLGAQPPHIRLRNVLRIAQGIAQGMLSVHQAGAIHRDIKPGNILINANLSGDVVEAVICDFGVTIKVDEARKLGICGTRTHTSPQLAKTRCATQSDDVWAFGTTFFRVLKGYDGRWAIDAEKWYDKWYGNGMPESTKPRPTACITWLETAASEPKGAKWNFPRPKDAAAGADKWVCLETTLTQLVHDTLFKCEQVNSEALYKTLAAIQLPGAGVD